MASLYTRGDKIWILYHINGKRVRKSLNLIDNRENKKIARRIKKQIEADLDAGILSEKYKKVKRKGLTLKDAYAEFLKTKEEKSEKTIIAYDTAFYHFSDYIGDIQLRSICEADIKDFINSLKNNFVRKVNNKKSIKKIPVAKLPLKELKKLSNNTVANYNNHLKIIFDYFVKMDFIEKNYFIRLKPEEKSVVTISQHELDTILAKLKKHNDNHYRVIKFFLLTGLRTNELVRLRFEYIDFEHNLIKIINTKGKREDIFPLYPKLRKFILENWKYRSGKLFDYASGDSFKFWSRFLEKNGYKHYSIHTLRKTFLTQLVNSGVSLYDIKTIARHTDIRTTLKYYLHADMNKLGTKIDSALEIESENDEDGFDKSEATVFRIQSKT